MIYTSIIPLVSFLVTCVMHIYVCTCVCVCIYCVFRMFALEYLKGFIFSKQKSGWNGRLKNTYEGGVRKTTPKLCYLTSTKFNVSSFESSVLLLFFFIPRTSIYSNTSDHRFVSNEIIFRVCIIIIIVVIIIRAKL